ncbi:MAG: methyl-accepting chemotaxis protein [Candidatus Muiribacteriota bacterium]
MFEKISSKMYAVTGFFVIIILILIITMFNAFETIQGEHDRIDEANYYQNFFTHMVVDHHSWVNGLMSYVVDDSQTQIDVELNHTQCNLGKFLYGDDVKELIATFPELENNINQIYDPHEELHSTAVEINSILSSNGVSSMDEAVNLLNTETMIHLADVGSALNQVDSTLENNISDIQEAIINKIDGRKSLVRNVSIILIIIGIGLAAWLGYSFKKSIGEVLGRVQELNSGEGDLTQRINIKNKDETHELAENMNTFIDDIHKMVGDVNSTVVELQSINSDLTGYSEKMLTSSENNASSVNDTKESINELIENIASINNSINNQVSAISETTAAIEELSASIDQVSKNTENVRKISVKTSKTADDGGKEMDNTIQAMKELNENSQKINNIVTLIRDISEQTNLLALNAAIEAARAGEHGKGFSVVADEVKKLSERSHEATKEIEQLIKNMLDSSEKAGVTLGNTNEILKNIIKETDEISLMMTEISEATVEENKANKEIMMAMENLQNSSEEINVAMKQQDSSSQKIGATMEEIAVTSEDNNEIASSLTGITQTISNDVEKLSKLVNKFKI